jgi:hypothetical protein
MKSRDTKFFTFLYDENGELKLSQYTAINNNIHKNLYDLVDIFKKIDKRILNIKLKNITFAEQMDYDLLNEFEKSVLSNSKLNFKQKLSELRANDNYYATSSDVGTRIFPRIMNGNITKVSKVNYDPYVNRDIDMVFTINLKKNYLKVEYKSIRKTYDLDKLPSRRILEEVFKDPNYIED